MTDPIDSTPTPKRLVMAVHAEPPVPGQHLPVVPHHAGPWESFKDMATIACWAVLDLVENGPGAIVRFVGDAPAVAGYIDNEPEEDEKTLPKR